MKKTEKPAEQHSESPRNLRIIRANGEEVLLEWDYVNETTGMFLIEWSRDGSKFSPIDEIKSSKSLVQISAENRAMFRFKDKLPTSGNSQYRVRAFESHGGTQSEPSNAVVVSIPSPAKGDI
jgi:hypothetical protein